MKTYDDFYLIEIADGGGSYPALLGIGWENDILEVINFKKRAMTFENPDIRDIAPMDPTEGWRYVELVKEEAVRGWDHAYKRLMLRLWKNRKRRKSKSKIYSFYTCCYDPLLNIYKITNSTLGEMASNLVQMQLNWVRWLQMIKWWIWNL